MDLPPDSRTALRDWLTEQLADLLGEPLADVRALADDDDLLGCGLDSIRLMYLQERLRARGSTLDFAQLAQRPCLGPGSTCWPARTGCPPRQRSRCRRRRIAISRSSCLPCSRPTGWDVAPARCWATSAAMPSWSSARGMSTRSAWPRRRSACVNATRCCGRASSTVASRSFRRRRCPASTCRTGAPCRWTRPSATGRRYATGAPMNAWRWSAARCSCSGWCACRAARIASG